MSYEWELFQLGMRREEWANGVDGLVMDWSDACGLTLFVFFKKPSDEEP